MNYDLRISIRRNVDNYTLIIILATLGFFALAAILLVPIYLFLKKEDLVNEKWTADNIVESVESRYTSARDRDPGSNESD